MKIRSLVVSSAVALSFALGMPGASAGPLDPITSLLAPLISQLLPGDNSGSGNVKPVTGVDPSCPADQVCRGFEVTCPGVQTPARGFIATGSGSGAARGVLVTFDGGIGRDYEFRDLEGADFLKQLRAAGITSVQVRWETPWLYASNGEDVGSHVLACRSASVIAWIHDTIFVPLGSPSLGVGRCGFCLTGNSGGASQISYALSHHGLDAIVDGIFPTSGPPHAAMAKACRNVAAESGYWFPASKADLIDHARGFFHQDGPCLNHDTSYTTRWLQEGVDTGGNDYTHPSTRIHFFLGALDDGYIRAHAQDYAAKLQQAGTTAVTVTVIPGMGHAPSKECLAALKASLLA